jgi:uncharacterized membrane protein
MDTLYKVVFTGRLLPGFNPEDVVANLTTQTNLDRERSQKLVAGSKLIVLKKGLDQETAEKFRSHFQKTGLEMRVVEASPEGQSANVMQPQPMQDTVAKPSISGEKRSLSVEDRSRENPYAAPKANLKTEKEHTGNWLDQPRKIPASHGWHWIKSATAMFMKHPWKWMTMALLYMLFITLFNLLPKIGPILGSILGMPLAGGMMLAAYKLDNGNIVRINYLFEGFRHNRNQLFLVGLYYLGFFCIFGAIMGLLMGDSILVFLGGGPESAKAIEAMVQKNMSLFLIGMLVIFALSIPVIMAVRFATPLVAISDRTAWTAYKMSFKGCMKNWLAFLVYSLAFFIMAIVIIAAVGVVSGLLAFFIADGNSFILALLPMVFILLLCMPLMVIGGLTVFTSFKDIYYQSA